MRIKIVTIILCASSFMFGQTNSKAKSDPTACDFVLEVDSTLSEKTYLLSSYLTDGNCEVFHSMQMRNNFATILQSKIPVSKEYFVTQFKDICLIDKCALQKVGVYRMSVPGEVVIIITYQEQQSE